MLSLSSRTTHLETAQSLAPLVHEYRDTFDRERRLPAPLVNAMHRENLFSLWVPAQFGGPELNLTDSFEIVEELSYLDGSVGWCACIASGVSRFAAFLPERTARRVFADDRAIMAGAFMPAGAAVAEPGGYRVTGQWSYASGIHHSRYVAAACFVDEHGTRRLLDDGSPEVRIVLVPTSAVGIIDTWDVGGLRGTGSHDFRVTNLFVPDDYSLKGLGDTPACPGALYRIPVYSVLPVLLAAVALGIARAAMDRFAILATCKVSSASSTLLRDDPIVQATIARAAARLRAARAFVMEAMATLWSVGEANEPFLTEHRLSMRLAGVEAVEAAKQATAMIHEIGGGASVYERAGLQRCFRDIYAVSQHMQTHTVNYTFCGKVLLGLEPGTPRF